MGKLCVLDIDSQGVKSIKKTDLNPFYVFILPPTLEELEVSDVSAYTSRHSVKDEYMRARVCMCVLG